MSAAISTSRATERLSARLRRAGLKLWVGKSSGDAWGRYLLFLVGGRCVAGCGWTLAEAAEIVAERIARAGQGEAIPR
jgi:hypothetical protein